MPRSRRRIPTGVMARCPLRRLKRMMVIPRVMKRLVSMGSERAWAILILSWGS